MSKKFAGLIATYSAAQALAPADLKDDYASVLRYLVQAKKAVDSRDLEQINDGEEPVLAQRDHGIDPDPVPTTLWLTHAWGQRAYSWTGSSFGQW
ncbi:MAG TPA: hypothetical protein VM429_10315 [Micropruina sp.]|nr:hypothetical protein [Micropruina sp.]